MVEKTETPFKVCIVGGGICGGVLAHRVDRTEEVRGKEVGAFPSCEGATDAEASAPGPHPLRLI